MNSQVASERIPVIVGVGQHTNHKGQQPGPEPLDLLERAVRLAADDAGITSSELARADFVGAAPCVSWTYDDLIIRLAERIGASPRMTDRPTPAGTSGITMMRAAAEAIQSGGADMAVIAGGEAMATRRHFARAGEELPWSHPAPAYSAGYDLDEQQHPGEVASGLTGGIGAAYSFAMRDIARRAHLRIEPESYRRQNSELLSGMTRVAAENPHAWFREERSADFLNEITPDNRWIAYPYAKHNVAIMDVDMAAAQILMSKSRADALGIAEEKRVYPMTFCYANDPVFTGVRPNLWKSPAMKAASNAVLDATGLTMDEVAHVDLYSCFSSAVNLARDALDIADRGGERITTTGGLPFAGGPYSAYACTSATRMVERLRSDPGSTGLLSGIGMIMTHHCYGLLTTRPPENVQPIDEPAIQANLDAIEQLPVRTDYAGPCTIATYTTIHDRDGKATSAPAIVDLPDGSRAHGRILDPDLIQAAMETEFVGTRMTLIEAGDAGELRLA